MGKGKPRIICLYAELTSLQKSAVTVSLIVDGSDKYKARYVAKRYSQKMGVDYEETFSVQLTVVLSTCEAEYMVLAATTQESLYLVQLLEGIEGRQYPPPKVYEDNQGALALAKNPISRQRCKHVDIKYHIIRSTVNDGKISLDYCTTGQMVADVMTKPATKFKLIKFAKYMIGD